MKFIRWKVLRRKAAKPSLLVLVLGLLQMAGDGAFAALSTQTKEAGTSGAQLLAGLARGDNPTPCGGGGTGDGLPSPFDINQKAELADHEKYLLVGTIRLENGIPFFEVDLETHPWLASKRRKAVPYYPLINARSLGVNWKEYEDEYVKMVVEARASILTDRSTGKPQYVVSLYPMQVPVLIVDQSFSGSRPKPR